MTEQLGAVYDAIDARNKRPQAHPNFSGYCKALWCMADAATFAASRDLEDLYKYLRGVFGDDAYIYESGCSGEPREAALHWTLMQMETFHVDPAVANALADSANALAVARIIAEFPPIHITFRGIVRTQYGLFLAGYPNWDVNKLRARFREAGLVGVEPHPQDICHATLVRFKRAPTEHQLTMLELAVTVWRGRQLGELRPVRWEYGYGTWLQGSRGPEQQGSRGPEQPCLIASWPAGPAHWILHRGLSAGPNAALENRQDRLVAALNAGWDVELDIWFADGQLYLGHDWKAAVDGGAIKPFFLNYPGAWVHCKNMGALAYMLSLPHRCHYFVHDRDEATLTNTGEAWCYPGNYAGPRSICVLPETAPAAQQQAIWQPCAAVCSDYLPLHFISPHLLTLYV
jgi:hypothetical protein